MKRMLPILALSGLIAPQVGSATVFTFDDETSFLSATGATVPVPVPNLGTIVATAPLGDMTFTNGPGANGLIFGAAGFSFSAWSTVIPGNALAISDNESFNVDFVTPVASFGFQVHEPSATGVPPDTTNRLGFIESTYSVTLLSGGSPVGSTTFSPNNDVLTYFGIWSTSFFDRVQVVETTGGTENEYFGAFAAGVVPAPVALPASAWFLALGLGGLALSSRRRTTP